MVQFYRIDRQTFLGTICPKKLKDQMNSKISSKSSQIVEELLRMVKNISKYNFTGPVNKGSFQVSSIEPMVTAQGSVLACISYLLI